MEGRAERKRKRKRECERKRGGERGERDKESETAHAHHHDQLLSFSLATTRVIADIVNGGVMVGPEIKTTPSGAAKLPHQCRQDIHAAAIKDVSLSVHEAKR